MSAPSPTRPRMAEAISDRSTGKSGLSHLPDNVRTMLAHTGLLATSFIMIYPLLWLMASALRVPEAIFVSPGLWPGEHFTLENFTHGWEGLGFVSFSTFFINSFVITGLSVVGNIFSCALAGYAFARLRFPFRRTLFALMMCTIMLPLHALLIPQYILFSTLGWLDTFLPLVVPKFLATEAFFVFLFVQFFRAIPRELSEAARLDGCGHLQIFLRIFVPLSLPAIATTAAFSFIWTWNDFLQPLIYLNSPQNYTVPIGLSLFLDSTAESNFGALFAMSLLSLLPVIGFFLSFQRLLVAGIATTGLK
ncbi:carbohydrate ABC transporter permease [Hoeflea prorocentri]|uniref:Carbohydrate ABC transporter permease n=1 Tax=Hoeflea prorocentri TaxID=1922333 RepID=A0A9X3ZII9_9HYPH|nr:carbohydrate ABC transporter permease [Hoeflea prorocentri]MCY6381901.1 carbohydrate ABC transporter permease [Hoeflea prorocentri]MDA5399701.1 carbohydrate ABC transporter permease [Hoeflea prorocentri]